MALEEREPEVLKLNVLLLLLHHPEGVEFGDFSGAFHQLHGCHPNISLYGYSSLNKLVAGMKNLVVVEGSSQRPVLKLAKGFHLAYRLVEENGSDSSHEETQFLIDEEEAEQQSALSDVLMALTNLLPKYKRGLKIRNLQKFLLVSDGIDLEKFSINQGYKDILEFLEDKMPELKIQYQENRLKCVVQLTADVCDSSASSSIQNQVEELTSQPPDACSPALSLDSDFSAYSSNTTSSGLMIQNSGTSNPAPCLDCSISACNTDAVLYKLMGKMSVALANVLAAVTSLLIKYQSGMKIKKFQKLLRRRNGIDLEKFSIGQGYKDSLEFLEDQMPELNIRYHEKRRECVIQLTTNAYTPFPSLDSDFSSCSSNTTPSRPTRKKSDTFSASADIQNGLEEPARHTLALSDVLMALTNLLPKYKRGLKIRNLQKFLLVSDGIDLEKFSINQGYKDILEFLEDKMPELKIQYQENRLKCVVQLTAGFGDNTKSLNPFCDTSLSKPQDQSLPVPAASVSPPVDTELHTSMSMPWPPSFPSFEKACSTSSPKVLDSSELLCPIPVQQPSASPPDRVSYKWVAGLPRKSSLTENPSSKDLELKQQVARILAAHPEGMSLFHFRGAYSAMYQQYLPLGNASSVKQLLLEMPDVVHLKGCGVQTLLLPVSSVSPVKTSQALSSTVDKTSIIPGCTLPPTTTVTEPAVALKPNPVSKAPGMPQHCSIPLQAPEYRMPDVKEPCILPEEQTPRALKTTNPWQEHQSARVNAEDILGQPDLFGVRIASVEPGKSLPTTSLPATQKTAVMPKPPPHPSLLQKSPTPAECTQGYVRRGPKPAYALFPPQPLVFPTDSQAVRLNEHFKHSDLIPKPTFLTNPQRRHNSTPVPSASQQIPTDSALWAQPVVYQPTIFLPAVPNIPSSYPTSFCPAPENPYGIQLQKTALQSHLYVPAVAPRKLAQMTSPTHSTEQWTCNQAVLQPNTISQMQMLPQTLQCSAGLSSAGHHLVSSPFQNTTSFRSPNSETVCQPEYSNHSLQDGQQVVSLPVAEEKLPDGALKRKTSELSSSRDPRQCNDADCLVTSSSMLFLSSPSPTIASLLPSYASSNIKKISDSPLEPLAFRSQPQPTSRSTATSTSGTRPSCSSFSEPTTSPHHQPLHPLSSTIASVSEVLSSEPQSFVNCQSYTSPSAAVTMSTTCPSSSPLHSVVSTTSSFHQPSNDPLGVGIDFDVSDKMDVTPTVFKQAGSRSVSLLRNRTSYDSSPQASPPPHSVDKCVIL